MRVTIYPNGGLFLEKAQAYLERQEVATGLMLGISLRLQREAPLTPPFLATVEDDRGLALAAVMTPPHKLVLYSHLDDPSEAVRTFIEQLAPSQWTVPGVLGPENVSGTFARLWGKPHVPGMYQCVYELREVIHPAYPPGTFRGATAADLDRVAEWVHAFQLDIGEKATPQEAFEAAQARIAAGAIYLWDHQGPVSMAAKTRPTPHGIAVNLVYTPPAARRNGYATACVARLSQLLLDSGYEFCTLFTDLANPTSNSVYQQIGYVPVCDFNEYRFAE
jgi:uncharacterized protein